MLRLFFFAVGAILEIAGSAGLEFDLPDDHRL
jgi:hypothetical protein